MWRTDSRALRVQVGVATVAGPRHDINQDRVIAAPGVFGLADGMGGPGGGDIAADIAATEVVAVIAAGGDGLDAATAAHVAVQDRRSDGSPPRMGTTLCFGVVGWRDQTPAVQVLNIGDSRAYLVSTESQWRQLSHDQSLVQDLVDRGVISAQDARTHPRRNVITSAVGHDVFEPQTYVVDAVPNVRLVFCSDGVNDVIPDDNLRRLVTGRSPHTAAADVIEHVVAVGGHDDATIVVAEVVAVPQKLPNLSQ